MATKVKTKPEPKPSVTGVHVPAPEVLTLAEAAAFLRVAEDAVRAELESGRLGGRELAGEWRVGRAAILHWLEAPAPRPPLTGAELAEHAKAVKAKHGFTETDDEVEAFIAEIYDARRARGTVGDAFPG